LVGTDIARVRSCLRARTGPGDLLGRVQLLLLAFALVDAAGTWIMIAAALPSTLPVAAVAVAAPAVLAATWVLAYRREEIRPIDDALIVGSVCAISIFIDPRLQQYVLAILTAAVFYGAAFSSPRRVLVRTALLSAIALGNGLTNTVDLTMASIFVVGFALDAALMHAMARTLRRYERTARRERILARFGLELLGTSDLEPMVAPTLDNAAALAGTATRITLAMAGEPGQADRYTVLGAIGCDTDGLVGTIVEPARLGGGDEEPAAEVPETFEPAAPFRLMGLETVVTPISLAESVRGLLIVEAAETIEPELPAALSALAAQVSLALSRLELQHELLESESAARFQALIQSASDVISIVTPDGLIKYESPTMAEIFGMDPAERLGTDFRDIVHPDDSGRVEGDFQRALSSGDYAVTECRIRHADGSWRYTEIRMTNLVDNDAVGGIVLNTRDVTERHNLEAELRHQAFHDALTGLANRTLFSNRVEHALTSSKRDVSTIAVLYCDLEGFKRVNDSLGLSAGDLALTMIAERLGSCVRGHDTVARLGGNEFGVLLDRLASPADATLAMERIMAVLRQPLQLPGAQVELQPHVGIAVAVGGDETAEDLLRNGAVAMHQARIYEGGYALFDPEMHADAIRRIEVESQLRTAIDESQFILHYQPTIDLQSGRITGVEALVRWQHPRRGLVPPMEFIPLAEETGLIVPLGQWAIREACQQVRVWQKEIPADEPICLNVNLSARQLRHPNIVRDVADALDDTGLLPSRLILEITESVLMVDTAATLNRLFQLKSLGVRLAVDDFGTGYSSFAYLRRFPVDILKIDKSFVDGVATEPTASALVDAMIRIGKTLRLETVAEGVEKVEQADRLRSLQCDVAQGYLFSRPLPSESVTEMLRAREAQKHANAA
jgi:diguanylate cyclase (GGDEF)-like protein/PAS domain S-box-containing protein